MKRLRPALFAGLAAALSVGHATAAPVDRDAVTALSALRTQDRRSLSIGWRLAEAAADLCRGARPGLGWSLHDLDQYRPGLRPAAATAFGLGAGELGVLAIAPDGPAAQAGVREGDVILAFGPVRFDQRHAITSEADHAPLAQATEAIAAATNAAPVTVRLRRGERLLDLTVSPRVHCAWPVQVETSTRLYAASDGVRVAVSSALADFARRDDDLAFIIAHEMAHNLRRPHETGDRRGSRAREIEADRGGLILAARAGYDTSGASRFIMAVSRRAGPRIPWFDGHPPAAERAAALERLHLQIETERRAGRRLRP